ncbi:hypothetical protein ACFW9F_24565 [Streptomyces sp. NPDC059506]|uniref:hypothetical protein n=1 Tax=Streptomyces TaxID=1883 RepID=UPI0015F8DC2A|nr:MULTISPECIES: hypothetical protein [unclassified Streptomyces]MCZ2523629.1 hypothetical protein [Streptomyces sp. HB2AG]
MRRHEFEPARLLAGLAFAGIASAFAVDAAGWRDVPGWLVVPVLAAALGLAGLVSAVTRAVRARRPGGGLREGAPVGAAPGADPGSALGPCPGADSGGVRAGGEEAPRAGGR